ncbi:MAG: hypothetical protein FWF23_05500 [Alphaproteobacteria bacterium]|nr:hypothetical protein [Alphaproteobacteria bacterium]MCL2505591.1 hypothetical protein [Alphaproteobacteria bacterium]
MEGVQGWGEYERDLAVDFLRTYIRYQKEKERYGSAKAETVVACLDYEAQFRSFKYRGQPMTPEWFVLQVQKDFPDSFPVSTRSIFGGVKGVVKKLFKHDK